MTLEKLPDNTPAPCLNPAHDPPRHISLKPGRYRHTCPGCGATMVFTVPGVIA